MTTPYLSADIARDEGCELSAYQDTVGVWTIGVGHTGPEVAEGLTWTQAQADDQLAKDIFAVLTGLDRQLAWWRSLDDVRQDAIANMAFNLGVDGLLEFHHTLAAIEAGDWRAASVGMLASKWARQVGDRAMRLAQQMRTGTRP